MAPLAVDALIALAEFDQTSGKLAQELAQGRQRCVQLTQEITSLQQQQHTVHNHVLELKRTLAQQEHELTALIQKQQLKEQQLSEQRNAQQFKALQQELALLVPHKELLEQRVFELLEAVETAQLQKPTLLQDLTEEIAHLQQELTVLNAAVTSQETQVVARVEERTKYTAQLSSEFLHPYERVRAALPNPVVHMLQGNCGGCSMQLTLAQKDQLKLKRMIRCDACQRFIVEPAS